MVEKKKYERPPTKTPETWGRRSLPVYFPDEKDEKPDRRTFEEQDEDEEELRKTTTSQYYVMMF